MAYIRVIQGIRYMSRCRTRLKAANGAHQKVQSPWDQVSELDHLTVSSSPGMEQRHLKESLSPDLAVAGEAYMHQTDLCRTVWPILHRLELMGHRVRSALLAGSRHVQPPAGLKPTAPTVHPYPPGYPECQVSVEGRPLRTPSGAQMQRGRH